MGRSIAGGVSATHEGVALMAAPERGPDTKKAAQDAQKRRSSRFLFDGLKESSPSVGEAFLSRAWCQLLLLALLTSLDGGDGDSVDDIVN